MASVHAVTHTRFGKRAAIKIAHRSVLGEQYTPQTFLREARIVHRIDHPAVIDVFATGSCEGRPYLVMERLTGCSLGERVDDGPMPRSDALEILLELADVLRAAHAAGVVHRDLKLDNVFVCDAPFAGGKRVKLLDWGVAHVAGEEDPFRGLIAGTLTYVAPEQIRGDSLTPAADVYSLAVVAYHMLCRRPPFAARTDLELIHLHLRAEPPRPNVAWPGIPGELDALLVAMLAKRPEDRPSLDEVERVLEKMLARLAPARRPVLEDIPAAPPVDMLGRPAVLPVPPLSWAWVGLAGLVAGLAGLLNALP
jgi:serine/threonine-protein kinase